MSTTDASQIHDLRSALDFLREMPGQLLETDTQVDPDAEVSGVYRHVGAGGTVMRPTKEGPAMVFNNVKGFDDAKVCIGMLASRQARCRPARSGRGASGPRDRQALREPDRP